MSEHTHQINGIEPRIRDLEDAVFGDRTNPTKQPGLIVEHFRMGLEQKRTNEILTEFRGDIKKISLLVVAAIVTGVVEALLKH